MARGAAVGARTQERTGRRGRGAREGVEVTGSVSYGHRLGTRAHTIRFPIRMPAQALHYHLANRPVGLQHFEHIPFGKAVPTPSEEALLGISFAFDSLHHIRHVHGLLLIAVEISSLLRLAEVEGD